MFEVIFIILIIYIAFKKSGINLSNITSTVSLLNKALKNQQFSNIKTMSNSHGLSLITADSHGENYLFVLKNISTPISFNELDYIYNIANKFHIHNVVIISKDSILPSSPLGKKIVDYNFEVWTIAKLVSLTHTSSNNNSTYTKSVLRKSDTSYDNCKIDNTPVDPIQHGTSKSHSLLGNIFQKPNRL